MSGSVSRTKRVTSSHQLLLAELRAAGQLELDRCAVDGSHIRALNGGTTAAPRRSTAAVPVPSTT